MITRRSLLSNAMKTGIALSIDSPLLREGSKLLAEAKQSNPAFTLPPLPEMPAEARPWVYWFWFNGDVTKEGITADLEAMHRIGIGGAIILCVGFGSNGPVRYLSPLWFEINRHTLSEASRLNMQIDLNNDDGWSDAGGPWLPAEHAMQKLVWTEQLIEGDKPITLRQPETKHDYYRDIRTIAMPAPLDYGVPNPASLVTWHEGKPAFVTHDLGNEPITCRSAWVRLYTGPEIGPVPITFELQSSMDGKTFTTFYRFDNRWRWTAQTVARTLNLSVRFAPVTGRYFRMVLPFTGHAKEPAPKGKKANPLQSNDFGMLRDDRIAQWTMKAGHDMTGRALEEAEHFPNGWKDQFDEAGTSTLFAADPASVIYPDKIIDLTDKLDGDHLNWTPPAGRWLVLRIGHTPTGAVNGIASKEGKGLMVSMFSSEAMDFQFAAVAEKVMAANPEYIGKSLAAWHMDSSECGPQNWHSNFPREFESRRGYSLYSYLPVLAGGRIVTSVEHSERFLWDFRRTMADLIAEKYWGRYAELAHKHNTTCSLEASGRMQFMNDPVLYLSKADMPMGEFWTGEPDVRPDCACCRSAANAYGRKVVLGEAYTSASWAGTPNAGKWQDHPYTLKQTGDRAFCAGINHFAFHRSISQPKLNEFPGLAWGTKGGRSVGINMERTNTWWDSGGAAWMSYLARTAQVLQSGREVVDIAVLMNEGVPNRLITPDNLPRGYRFDGLHHSMLANIKVDRGEMLLPSGMRYRILVLPSELRMRPENAREITRLAKAGITIAGNKPTGSPSLQNHPHCDTDTQREASTWSNIHADIAAAIKALNLSPDVHVEQNTAEPASTHPDIHFMHRHEDGADAYFLSNQSGKPINIRATFRIAGRHPELLDTDLGTTTPAGVYNSTKQTTTLPLTLEPSGSVVVLFRKPAGEAILASSNDKLNHLTTQLNNHQTAALNKPTAYVLPNGDIAVLATETITTTLTSTRNRKATLNLTVPPARTLTAPWRLSFPPNWGVPAAVTLTKLISWSEHADEGVRHFSGTATYSTTLIIEAGDLAPNTELYLDLGSVAVIASATLNGQPLGTRWKPPFLYDVTSLLKPGENTLEVAVTNLWPNRMIGDAALPADKRFTHSTFEPYDASTPLLPSGLIGPVRLVTARRQTIRWK